MEKLKDHKIIIRLQISVTEISAYINKILNTILKKKSKKYKKYLKKDKLIFSNIFFFSVELGFNEVDVIFT